MKPDLVPETHPEVTYDGRYWTVHKEGTSYLLRRPGAITHVSSVELAGLPRRRLGKPTGKYGLFTDAELHVFHAAHIRGQSLRDLGRQHWQKAGAASAHSAAMAIANGLKRLGLEVRVQSHATASANRQRRAADSPGTHDRSAYKRYLRAKAGGQRPCQGKRTQYPRKGEPCSSWAMDGSLFCVAHDPARKADRDAHLARARSVRKVAA